MSLPLLFDKFMEGIIQPPRTQRDAEVVKARMDTDGIGSSRAEARRRGGSTGRLFLALSVTASLREVWMILLSLRTSASSAVSCFTGSSSSGANHRS